MDTIPVAGPWITQLEINYATDAAKTAWNKDHYVYNARFEKAVADYVGAEFGVSLPHCTAAIHLSLAAMGIGKGDEVIVPDVTWIASVAPVIYVGADPMLTPSHGVLIPLRSKNASPARPKRLSALTFMVPWRTGRRSA